MYYMVDHKFEWPACNNILQLLQGKCMASNSWSLWISNARQALRKGSQSPDKHFNLTSIYLFPEHGQERWVVLTPYADAYPQRGKRNKIRKKSVWWKIENKLRDRLTKKIFCLWPASDLNWYSGFCIIILYTGSRDASGNIQELSVVFLSSHESQDMLDAFVTGEACRTVRERDPLYYADEGCYVLSMEHTLVPWD